MPRHRMYVYYCSIREIERNDYHTAILGNACLSSETFDTTGVVSALEAAFANGRFKRKKLACTC